MGTRYQTTTPTCVVWPTLTITSHKTFINWPVRSPADATTSPCATPLSRRAALAAPCAARMVGAIPTAEPRLVSPAALSQMESPAAAAIPPTFLAMAAAPSESVDQAWERFAIRYPPIRCLTSYPYQSRRPLSRGLPQLHRHPHQPLMALTHPRTMLHLYQHRQRNLIQ